MVANYKSNLCSLVLFDKRAFRLELDFAICKVCWHLFEPYVRGDPSLVDCRAASWLGSPTRAQRTHLFENLYPQLLHHYQARSVYDKCVQTAYMCGVYAQKSEGCGTLTQ